MKQKLFTIFSSVFACAITFLFPIQTLAADKIAEMAFTASESQYEVGKEFSVNLRVDGNGQPFTSFKSNVTLNNVTIVSLSKGSSVTKWLTEPSASSPSFFGAISGETTSINVYSLTVKINKAGSASIQLSNNAIYWTDGYTVLDVLGTSKSLTLTGIAAKPISKTTKSSTSTSTLGDNTKTTENTPATQENTTQPETNEQDQISQPISNSEEPTKLDTPSEENVSKEKPTLLGWIINNKISVITFFIILILIVITTILWVKNRKYVSLINKIMNDNALLSSQSTLDQSLESQQDQSTNYNYIETKPQSESSIISSDNTYSASSDVSDITQNNDIVTQNNSIINANTNSDSTSSNEQASDNQNVPHAVNAPSQIPPNNSPLS